MVSSMGSTSTALFTLSSSLNSFRFRKNKPYNFIPKLNVTNTNKPYESKSSVSEKLKSLASEFTSLGEPIERVKKLLHYASLLAPLREEERVSSNRVPGCATEVWVVAEMDSRRRMRFRADSDSEISKGFCWCLVWLLDGAKPEEVLSLHKEDLADINVGLGMSVKAHSRVNTWHNVLFTMQNAAR